MIKEYSGQIPHVKVTLIRWFSTIPISQVSSPTLDNNVIKKIMSLHTHFQNATISNTKHLQGNPPCIQPMQGNTK